jgi:prepilin-type N-terminal cleavage/methylation domain-containing protein
MRQKPTTVSPRRAAFTLIEILVVIAIIVILVALLAAGIIAWSTGQQTRNTELHIRTSYKLLQQKWSAVVDDAKKEDISGLTTLQTLAAPDPTGQRARVIWIKARLMEAFPMSFTEAVNPPAVIPLNRQKYLAAFTRQITPALASPGHNVNTEPGACLAMTLAISPSGKAVSSDDLGAICLDTDGDGLKEVVDGYRMPVGFDRFGTSEPGVQAANPGAGNAATRFADPLDPQGYLLTPTWYSSAAGSNCVIYQTAFSHQISATAGQSANYVLPVIFSGGPDLNYATTNDNIYSFMLK